MRVTLVILVLALAVGATELRWDDGDMYGSATLDPIAAVLFLDAVGDDYPGDTGGLPGTVSELLVCFYYCYGEPPPEYYIYSRDGNNPGEVLAGPLAYTEYELGESWFQIVLDEPVDVPGEFFAVVKMNEERSPWPDQILLDPTHDYGFNHSRGCASEGDWYEFVTDLGIRVEWEPQEPGVEAVSWGIIKASGIKE
ncbi:MAG: hypothetical protein NTW26_04405 [bacterium]|nr:hypothetical protein [bacterium]